MIPSNQMSSHGRVKNKAQHRINYLSVPVALTGQKITDCVPVFSPSWEAGRLLDVELRTLKNGPEPK